MNQVKLFWVSDTDIFAARTAEEARAGYLKMVGEKELAEQEDGEPYEPVEMSAEQFTTMKIAVEGEGDLHLSDGEQTVIAKDFLEAMIESKAQFPCFFATTEY